MNSEAFWVDPKLQPFLLNKSEAAGPWDIFAKTSLVEAATEQEVFSHLKVSDVGRALHFMTHVDPGDRTPGFDTLTRFEFVSYVALIDLLGSLHVLHAIWRAKFEGPLAAGVTAYPLVEKRIWSVGTCIVSELTPLKQ